MSIDVWGYKNGRLIRMPEHNNDVDIAVLQQQLIALKDKQETDHKALVSLQQDRDKALIWGIIVLGSTVISLGAWILKNILRII